MKRRVGLVLGWCSCLVLQAQHEVAFGSWDQLLAGAGRHPFLQPAAIFGNPSLLSGDTSQTVIECALNRFADLAITQKVQASIARLTNTHEGYAFRTAMDGRDQFRQYQFAAAYGMRLGILANGTGVLMGAQVGYQRTVFIASFPLTRWQAGLALTVDNIQSQSSLALLRQAPGKGAALTLARQQFWSEQLSTALSIVAETGVPVYWQFVMTYHFHPACFIRLGYQWSPTILAWENGYRIRRSWLRIQVMRYPLIGWRTGIGLVFFKKAPHAAAL